MICSKCQKRLATIHYVQEINGYKQELFLCGECASESATLDTGTNFPIVLNDLLNNLLVIPTQSMRERQSKEQSLKKCSFCGADMRLIAKTGKLGCANCYDVFKPELSSLIQKIHGKASHTGKTPFNSGKLESPAIEKQEEPSQVSEIDRLKQELQNAIQTEEYEKAAKLRDMIRAKEV